MKIKQIKSTLLTAAILVSGISHAKDEPKVSYKSTEVAKGIYMLAGEGGFTGGNIGLLIGVEGVVLIDDSMPPFLDILNQAIKGLTDQPIDFLINTHVHGDHTGNNEPFGQAGTHIVAHDNLRKHLINKGVQTSDGMAPAPKAALPVLTFSNEMSFHFNDQPATAIHVPNAHTDGDAIIHFSQANVIHAGDTFFNGLFPYIDIDSGGSVDGFIHAQLKMISLSNDETTIIPGHGPLSNKQELQAAVDMLIDAKAIINKHIKEGMTLEAVLEANPLAKYHDDWNWGFITTERMTTQLFNDLSQAHSHQGQHNHAH
ncbi:MBL fold metallo-hydrolase [Marinicella litoralis]|uniref:Glyoxylase-like metal-dependent hydrolase (Beta-lactamase superfamily II) n=1 Tax=Marinicella litoralis TaxID=644220 RepID=A0A4R6XVY4_9GAMM|nr:MBL fold metallo-hydrolase [Marinicella litoralis]TDR20638.1 glyoxylase-like metal-dependent hydrolase (beta-lactamase superfamily II) [Marinicella litoralis]